MNGAPARVQGVLLDIEGTTTPLAFVTEVLFPYARDHLRSHLEHHADEYKSLLDRLRDEHDITQQRGETVPEWVDTADARIASVVTFVHWLMDRDRKTTPLKELQGLIWEAGYKRHALVGQVFPDVASAFQRWKNRRLAICIYSSGSVLAQQLLFRHSSAGDLTSFIDGFFDTTVGTKVDPDSYRRIAQSLGLPPPAILFLSDVARELDAARSAGMNVALVVRPGNVQVEGHDFAVIHSFEQI